MIYGYEEPVVAPSMGVYDTTLMRDYVNDVIELEKERKSELEKYFKDYGSFVGPDSATNQWYNDKFVNSARQLINGMIANGIDPFKSPEAGRVISRFIADRPYGDAQKAAQQAANRAAYLKSEAEAKAKNPDYDPEYEKARLRLMGIDPDNWTGVQDGQIQPWDVTSVQKQQTDADFFAPSFSKLKKTEYLGPSNIPGYDNWGVSPQEVNEMSAYALSEFLKSPHGQIRLNMLNKQLDEQEIKNGQKFSPEERDKKIAEAVTGLVATQMLPYLQREQKLNKEHSGSSGGSGGTHVTVINNGGGSGNENTLYSYANSQLNKGVSKITGIHPSLLLEKNTEVARLLNSKTNEEIATIVNEYSTKDGRVPNQTAAKKLITDFGIEQPMSAFETFHNVKLKNGSYIARGVDLRKMRTILDIIYEAQRGPVKKVNFQQHEDNNGIGGKGNVTQIVPMYKLVTMPGLDGRMHLYDVVQVYGIPVNAQTGKGDASKRVYGGYRFLETDEQSTLYSSGTIQYDPEGSNMADDTKTSRTIAGTTNAAAPFTTGGSASW